MPIETYILVCVKSRPTTTHFPVLLLVTRDLLLEIEYYSRSSTSTSSKSKSTRPHCSRALSQNVGILYRMCQIRSRVSEPAMLK